MRFTLLSIVLTSILAACAGDAPPEISYVDTNGDGVVDGIDTNGDGKADFSMHCTACQPHAVPGCPDPLIDTNGDASPTASISTATA